jgi:hypothetical protein
MRREDLLRQVFGEHLAKRPPLSVAQRGNAIRHEH